MTIDFHSEKNRYTYASREAHDGWTRTILEVIDPCGFRVADVGCGGGIYAKAWADLGAATVVGVDFSEQMVIAARENAQAQKWLRPGCFATGWVFGRGNQKPLGNPKNP